MEMIRSCIAFVVVAMGFTAVTGNAQQPPPQVFPDIDLMIHGIVMSIDVGTDGSLVFGGNFASVNGVDRGNIARLRADRTLDPQWRPRANGDVTAVAHDTDGNIYVAGHFSSIDGALRSGLAKLNPSGDVDTTWSPSPGGTVTTLLVDGEWLYLGGSFDGVDGVGAYGLVRVSLSGAGQVDETWAPSLDGAVSGLAADDEFLFITGQFNQVSGLSRSGVAKLSKVGTGAVDDSWNVAIEFGYARSVQLDGKGNLYLGGTFNNVNGLPRQGLAKVSSSGPATIDPEWNPSANNSIYAISIGTDGYVYVGGWFTQAGGMQRMGVVRLAPDGSGSADPAWDAQLDFYVYDLIADGDSVHVAGNFSAAGGRAGWGIATLDSDANAHAPDNRVAEQGGYARAFLRQSNGGLIVGGQFSAANHLQRRNLLRITPEGLLDETWDPHTDSTVWALAEAADGAVIVGGQFNEVGGLARSRLARVSPAGSGAVDPTWNPSANGSVGTLATNDAGELFVGGLFTEVGGITRNRIAKLSSIGAGVVDPQWNPNADSTVLAIERGPAGTVFASGWFTTIGGAERRSLAKLDDSGVGAADAAWNPEIDGLQVGHLEYDPAGWLYAAGGFETVGQVPLRRLAKFPATGTGQVVATWNASLDFGVDALAVDTASGDLFISGSFTTVAGLPRFRMAKLFAGNTAVADPDWNPGPTGPDLFRVHALLVEPSRSSVYVGGPFTRIGGQARSGFARLLTDADMIFVEGFD